MWLLVFLLVQTAAFGFHEKEWHEKSYDCYPIRAQQYRENQQAHGFGASIIALCPVPVQWAIIGGCCAYAVGKNCWDWWSDNYGSRHQQKVCEKNIYTLQRILHKDQHQYP